MLIECTVCHHQYQADERLAGKRLRCKHCGNIIDVPLPEPDLAADADSPADLNDLASLSGGAEDIASASAGGVRMTHPTVPPGSQLTGGYSQMERTGEADEYGLASNTPFDDRRPNTPFVFPGAAELDEWLPWIFVLGGLILSAWMYARWESDAPLWVMMLRPVVYIGLFLLIVWPLATMGLRKGAQRARLRLPPQLKWRSLAIFTITFFFATLMWWTGEDVVSLILGLVVGLVLAILAMWLLLRLNPPELAPVGVNSVAAFIAGAAIMAALLIGGDLGLLAALRSQQKLAGFPTSPLGPALYWAEAPVKSRQPKMAGRVSAPHRVAKAPPLAQPQPQVAEASPPKVQPPPEVVQNIPPQPPAPLAPPPATTRPDAVSVSVPPAAVEQNNKASADEVFKPASPIVRTIEPLSDTGNFDGVIYPSTSSNHMAIIRDRGTEGDVIELWSFGPLKKISEARFNHAPGMRDHYILSPDGDLMVRIVNWPRMSAQVWSFSRRQVVQSVDLDSRLGQAMLIGFANDTQFVVQWTQGDLSGMEYLDAVTGRHLRQVNLPRGRRQVSDYAFSPDGKSIALPVQFDQGAYIALYEFPTGRPGRRFQLKDIDPHGNVQPAGIAFSPDGRRLAVLFQQNGNGLLLCWNVAGPVPPLEYIYPNGFGFIDRRELHGTALQWLDDTDWLLWGRGIIDADTGKSLGQVGLADVYNQHGVEPGVVQLVIPSAEAQLRRMVQVRFDSDHLASAKKAVAN